MVSQVNQDFPPQSIAQLEHQATGEVVLQAAEVCQPHEAAEISQPPEAAEVRSRLTPEQSQKAQKNWKKVRVLVEKFYRGYSCIVRKGANPITAIDDVAYEALDPERQISGHVYDVFERWKFSDIEKSFFKWLMRPEPSLKDAQTGCRWKSG